MEILISLVIGSPTSTPQVANHHVMVMMKMRRWSHSYASWPRLNRRDIMMVITMIVMVNPPHLHMMN